MFLLQLSSWLLLLVDPYTRNDPVKTTVRVPQNPTLGWVFLGIIKYFVFIIYIAKLLRTFLIVSLLLLTANSITVTVLIVIVTITFALDAIGIVW